jgi:hypothetical protein
MTDKDIPIGKRLGFFIAAYQTEIRTNLTIIQLKEVPGIAQQTDFTLELNGFNLITWNEKFTLVKPGGIAPECYKTIVLNDLLIGSEFHDRRDQSIIGQS